MPIPDRRSFRMLRLIAALIAVIGQGAIVGSALSLARDEASAAAHVESKGVSLHHGHDESTCPACRALSFHGQIEGSAPAPLNVFESALARQRRAAERSESPTFLTNLSRAPPVTA